MSTAIIWTASVFITWGLIVLVANFRSSHSYCGYRMGWILLVICGYGLILAVLTKDIIKARKVYRFQHVSLGRWTVRQPNGRFMRNLANVWTSQP
ncbi:hypothetical protein [Enterobacter phage 01_vB_Eclo_IJM]|nr:hypothetical protein [Enterobacter phage 01_vB_Eclo_IJM]